MTRQSTAEATVREPRKKVMKAIIEEELLMSASRRKTGLQKSISIEVLKERHDDLLSKIMEPLDLTIPLGKEEMERRLAKAYVNFILWQKVHSLLAEICRKQRRKMAQKRKGKRSRSKFADLVNRAEGEEKKSRKASDGFGRSAKTN